jgi:hypothetical protein
MIIIISFIPEGGCNGGCDCGKETSGVVPTGRKGPGDW